ncbi:hypothetical protein [aff. Roholtiella sp. LEGE 12411]|uniref:hypothetical protein n=1 Tax=aff. Roholtiella sp. LEGE 12411 TaxID=1828822 RepID=UPI001881E013|nr:hypothetical protein [aff. Roholtiella sp. LEGE 12411]MBE9038707.1 hypothetical protein [aff. Roholtiella sp. LEGE 12411]
MKKITINCDRCGTELSPGNWKDDTEVCDNCSNLAAAAAELASADIKTNSKSGESLKLLVQRISE